MTERSAAQPISLVTGQRTDIVAAARTSSEIRCLAGRLHIVSMPMGIGWTMRAGEVCRLRVSTPYRVTARTPARLAISNPS